MSQLASSSMDHSVMIWNFKPQLRAFRFVGHKGPVTSLDFASSGNVLASSSRDNTVRLWTPNVKGDVTVFKAHTSTVRMVQFSNDDENLVTCSDDKSIKLWSTHRTKFQYSLTGHLNWVRSAKFSPDARLILSGSDDKTVKLWDLNSKSCIKTYWDHTGVVTSVAFHPSGTTIATTSIDKSIKLFDIRTHKLIQHYGDAHGAPSTGSQTLDGSQSFAGGVNSVAFGGHNGEWLISTGMDGLIKVWDVKEGHLFYTLHGHKGGPTTSAVFSPNGDFFATGGSDSQVMVWKSNFDQIDKLDIEYDPIRQPTPHATQPFPHNQHMTHTELPGSNKLRPKTASPTFSSKVQTAKPALVSHKPSARIYDDREPIQLSAPIISDVNNMDADKSSTPFDFAGMNINTPKAATSPLQVQHIPDQVASTLSHIVRQIDILTQTMSILEVISNS
ncbi:WD40-repeat-containing domain protein [Globomyces pollinis-pini]|nr:WD40-repeat-containing domain protein [Globomyces pollinis-pini]